MGVVNSYIDHYTVRNTTAKPITLGDLVNVLVPAKKSIDLLKLPRVTKEKINQSHHLQIAIRSGWLVVSKPSKKMKTIRERQATVSDEIYEDVISLNDLTDVTLTLPPGEDDLLQYDPGSGQWVNRPPPEIDINLNVITVTEDYTATGVVDVILVDASSNITVTVTIPTAVGVNGKEYHVKKIDSSANHVDVKSMGTETIDGEDCQTITNQWTSLHLVSNNINWFVI